MRLIQGSEALVLSDGVAFRPLVFSRPRRGSLCLFGGDTVISMMLARFLRPSIRHGGILSSQTSGADGPLQGAVPSFRQVPD